jgi:hypothetical protein
MNCHNMRHRGARHIDHIRLQAPGALSEVHGVKWFR